MYKLDFEHADYIIAISDFDKDDIKSFYPKYRKKFIGFIIRLSRKTYKDRKKEKGNIFVH